VKRKKRILIAPLDWGLGHATRCIPLITHLQALGTEIIIAGSGQSLQLLKIEFANLEFLELPAYDISYGKNMAASIAVQLPKLIARISSEHLLLQKIIKEKKIDAVISDNRFGLWTKKIPCVFITHQVRIIMPERLSVFERMIFLLNRSFISKYNELWIPDFEGSTNLSGKLSHGISAHNSTHYIGPLSRFNDCYSTEKKYDIAVILSGPEPHRTNLEKDITDQLRRSSNRAIIVQGKPEEKTETQLTYKIKVLSHLMGKALNEVICSSRIIISRSGYSTVMDAAAIGAKAIFIPTPGQTEQEYIAEELKRKKIFYFENQEVFSLDYALKESESYTGLYLKNNHELLKKFLGGWLQKI